MSIITLTLPSRDINYVNKTPPLPTFHIHYGVLTHQFSPYCGCSGEVRRSQHEERIKLQTEAHADYLSEREDGSERSEDEYTAVSSAVIMGMTFLWKADVFNTATNCRGATERLFSWDKAILSNSREKTCQRRINTQNEKKLPNQVVSQNQSVRSLKGHSFFFATTN